VKLNVLIPFALLALLIPFALVNAGPNDLSAKTPNIAVDMRCAYEGALPLQNTQPVLVSFVDGSIGAPSLPTIGSNCAQALADLMKQGGFTTKGLKVGTDDTRDGLPTYHLVGIPGAKVKRLVVILICGPIPKSNPSADGVIAMSGSKGAPSFLPKLGSSCAQAVADIMNKGGFSTPPIEVSTSTYTFIR
jgi:hypothetical protein